MLDLINILAECTATAVDALLQRNQNFQSDSNFTDMTRVNHVAQRYSKKHIRTEIRNPSVLGLCLDTCRIERKFLNTSSLPSSFSFVFNNLDFFLTLDQAHPEKVARFFLAHLRSVKPQEVKLENNNNKFQNSQLCSRLRNT